MFYQNGQSRPQTKKGAKLAIATLVVMGASIAIPVLGAGSANAATLAEWDRVALCESGGQWNLPGGDRDSTGGLQFRVASWADALAYLRSKGIDTSSYPAMPYQATKQQQIMAGEALLALQGPRAWSVTFNGAPHCGNAAAGALSSGSMFEGGPNPYPAGSQPTTPPKPKPTPPSTPDTPPAKGDEKYTVKKGDHLSKIATLKKVEGGWKVIYDANVKVIGSNPNLILPGQVLTIPRPVVKHTVKAGDHLTSLAAKYKVAGGWKTIYEANKDVIGSNPNVIEIGMVLVIPNGSSPATPATPVKPTKPTVPAAPSGETENGWVLPIAKGSYIRGDGLINSGGCMSRSCGGHSGLDLSARQGTVVRAIGSGTVMHAGYGYAGAAYGNHVVIKHSDGRYTLYGHLSASVVRAGQTVSAGQMIGNVGSTGNSSGPHLHFEVRTSPNQFSAGVFLNPVTYLAAKGLSL